MAGSRSFAELVWAVARTVPPGTATTYGEIAEACFGLRRGARAVGRAMAGCPRDVPWWRVVRADGGVMPGAAGAEQRARLLEEGIPLTLDGRVDWRALGGPYSPERPDQWLSGDFR